MACGRGLRRPFDRIAFAPAGEGAPRLRRERAATPAWRFWSFGLDGAYLGAIALRRRRLAATAIMVETVAALPYAGRELGRVLRTGEF